MIELTRDDFLQRPDHKDDEGNQDAYDDDYGGEDYGPDSDDDLDLFGVDKKEEEEKQAEKPADDVDDIFKDDKQVDVDVDDIFADEKKEEEEVDLDDVFKDDK